ncbi:MAG TPA: hypothetical protein VFR63_07890 [Gaiellaceae bacterium]|nr:hypothetical protein [Gaiellaceae bacterium]
MTSRRRLLAVLAVAALAALLAAGAVVLSTGDGEGDGIAAGTGSAAASEPRSGGLDRCFGLADEARTVCYGEELAALVRSTGDADAALEEIAAEAYGRPESGLLADCHGLMHTRSGASTRASAPSPSGRS